MCVIQYIFLSCIHCHTQEAVASSKETGRDLEHCKTLMRRFSDFEKVSNYVRKAPKHNRDDKEIYAS